MKVEAAYGIWSWIIIAVVAIGGIYWVVRNHYISQGMQEQLNRTVASHSEQLKELSKKIKETK